MKYRIIYPTVWDKIFRFGYYHIADEGDRVRMSFRKDGGLYMASENTQKFLSPEALLRAFVREESAKC